MTGLADKLAEVAADAEPPAIDEGQARRLVDRALGLAAVQPRERTSIRWAVAFAAMAAAAAAIVIIVAGRDRASTDELRLTLPTGDRLVSAPGADFAVERLEPANRELRLHRGTVRFEVAHVVSGQRFRVATDDLVVTAKGTVFSIDTDTTGSRVRVLEGVVEIEQGAHRELVAAGGEFDSHAIASGRVVVATAPATP
ncbi:MAG TPA: FecR domain-containing protein, partial [Kofleriaceae bacterium]|nr:FecR domain-containing protein [Kofleriaceae bacterium]